MRAARPSGWSSRFTFLCVPLIVASSALALPAPAAAGVPGFVSTNATPLAPHSESVAVSVSTGGQATDVRLRLDAAEGSPTGPTCASPVDPVHGTLTPPQVAPGTAATQAVTFTLDGLESNVVYCYDVLIGNGSGSVTSGTRKFVAGVGSLSNVTVNEVTGHLVRFGFDFEIAGGDDYAIIHANLEDSEWCSSSGASGAPLGALLGELSVVSSGPQHSGLTSLIPDTAYCARLDARNNRGLNPGPFVHFRTAAPPENTADAIVEGEAVEGQTLHASSAWSSTLPMSLEYRWYWCAAEDCFEVQRSEDPQYTLVEDDVGGTILVLAVATSEAGAVAASSESTDLVEPRQPLNVSLPILSGPASQGALLEATTGSWFGYPGLVTLSYGWQRCDAAGSSCSTIAGASESTYRLGTDDAGRRVRVVVTARDRRGQATSAASEPTGTIPPPPAPQIGSPQGVSRLPVPPNTPPRQAGSPSCS